MPRRLWVRGHAGAGAAGQDVVCAAVSALVETLALALPKTPGWQGQIRVEEGAADFSFAEPISPEVRAVVEAIAAGLADLGTSHRRYVRYDDVEEPATAGRERGD
ncbi:MAG: ribosomal-processing cysteine protease Prp [Firmicutes bacterium]|nr:ribosomal-processing cysteine protease Prp [Alicyclobacillaceae bacterium]MCL6496974.1 ribosomal-processing cysteine protease Prp [Bacillota bacterium]